MLLCTLSPASKEAGLRAAGTTAAAAAQWEEGV